MTWRGWGIDRRELGLSDGLSQVTLGKLHELPQTSWRSFENAQQSQQNEHTKLRWCHRPAKYRLFTYEAYEFYWTYRDCHPDTGGLIVSLVRCERYPSCDHDLWSNDSHCVRCCWAGFVALSCRSSGYPCRSAMQARRACNGRIINLIDLEDASDTAEIR